MCNGIPPWVSIVVESFVIIKDMISCLDRIFATQTLEFFLREKSKSIFSYRGVICYCSCSPSTKQIWMAKELEPLPTFSCQWFNRFEIIVNKIVKVLFFKVWCLEKHFPMVWNVVTFILLTEIPRQFARKDWSKVELLCFFINSSMETPIATTRTIPKFNIIVVVVFEKLSKFTRNSSWTSLI